MNKTESSDLKSTRITCEKGTDEYLDVLEELNDQYQQYVDVSGLYELNRLLEQKVEEFLPPTPENPLTTNKIKVKSNAIME